MTEEIAQDLCGRCGLCCNGAIFADVQLGTPAEASRLKRLGLKVVPVRRTAAPTETSRSSRFKFAQPCAALQGCHCRIYPERPAHCRAFECLLFKNVQAGRLSASAAFGIVRAARTRVDVVQRLLRQLGDHEEHLPLRTRFRQVSKALESVAPRRRTAQRYAELTVAFHALNELLRDAFYR